MLALFACLPAIYQSAGLAIKVQGSQVFEGEAGEVERQREGVAARHRLAQIIGLVGRGGCSKRLTVKHGVEGRILVGVGRALVAESVELGEWPQHHPGIAQLG